MIMASFNGGSAAGGGGGGGQDGPHNKRLCTGQEMGEVPLNSRVSVELLVLCVIVLCLVGRFKTWVFEIRILGSVGYQIATKSFGWDINEIPI